MARSTKKPAGGSGDGDAAPSHRAAPRKASPKRPRSIDPDDPAAGAPKKALPYKRLDLIEAVCTRSTVKRSDAKAIVDLTLEELGRALGEHGMLALPPLGKLSVKRRVPRDGGGDSLTIKLRRGRTPQGDETPLAAAPEDG